MLPDQDFRSWEGRFKLHIQRPRLKAKMPGIGTDEKAAFKEMLRLMMAFKPEMWATVREVMEFEWMMKLGLPGLEEASKDFRSQ